MAISKPAQKKLAEVILGKYHSLPPLPDQLIFCFDTVVHDDRRVMGKPGSLKDAAQMLHHLNGTSHSVTTVCLAALNHTRQLAYFSTRVQFRKLRAEDIQEYLNEENVLDAAGAYKIQEKGLRLVNQIAGPYHNVVGLPIEFVTRFRD